MHPSLPSSEQWYEGQAESYSFIPKELISGKGRGFAFVGFETMREAEQAIELANGKSWGGRRINVQFANQRRKAKSSQLVNWQTPEPILGDPGKLVTSCENPWFNPLR